MDFGYYLLLFYNINLKYKEYFALFIETTSSLLIMDIFYQLDYKNKTRVLTLTLKIIINYS